MDFKQKLHNLLLESCGCDSPIAVKQPKEKVIYKKREFLKDNGLDSISASIIQGKYEFTANFTFKPEYGENVRFCSAWSKESAAKELPGLRKVHSAMGTFISKLEKATKGK